MEGVVNPSTAFWSGKSVFLTGHTGFKGSWLAHWLHVLGANSSGFALAPEGDLNLFVQSNVAATLRHTVGNILDLEALTRDFVAAKPEIIFHLAAQPLVRRSYAQPVETFATNVMGTVNVLQAARNAPSVKAVVVITTDKCYENQEQSRRYQETDPLGGHDPYSASKAAAELATAAYRSSFLAEQGISVATARAGNVLGGGDWAEDRLIPDCIRSFLRGEAVVIRNPTSTRPWQHVLEPLAGYLVLAERLHSGEVGAAGAFNFGPSSESDSSVGNVVNAMIRRWGTGAHWQPDIGTHVHEARLLAVDSSKARATLNWRPRLSLAETIEWTVDWYRSVAAGSSAADLTLRQIEAYQSKEALPS